MLNRYLLSFLLSFLFCLTLEQAYTQNLSGKVSFVTAKNVYVSFDRTDDISIGDTLSISSSGEACLLVSNKSSSSCVCVRIGPCELEKGTAISFSQKRNPQVNPITEDEPKEIVEEVILDPDPESSQGVEENSRPEESIRGRISVSEYSNLASQRDDRHRFMSRLSLTADHINHSKFSFETFINFRQFIPTNKENFDPATTFFRVYNLAVRYEVDPSFSIVLGRRINPKIASLGAIDGLQVEKSFGKLYVGAIAGARPDISDHRLNPNLLQYGGYVGTATNDKNFYSQTTLGAIEQRNRGNVDRRYAYFQHSSTIARRLTLFSSLEMDLYRSVNGVRSNEIRLPNLFISAMYRVGRKVNLTLSYDSRKQILYYKTFQTDIERLLDDDLARQGIRARINIRPIKYVLIGGSFSNRFQSDQQNQSDNIHAFATWTKIPKIGGRLSATYNTNSSNYLTSNILSVRHSRSLAKKKLNADVYYRLADYTFVNSEAARRQHYYGLNLSYRFAKKLVFTIAGERTDFNGETNYRIYTRIIKRFARRRS